MSQYTKTAELQHDSINSGIKIVHNDKEPLIKYIPQTKPIYPHTAPSSINMVGLFKKQACVNARSDFFIDSAIMIASTKIKNEFGS